MPMQRGKSLLASKLGDKGRKAWDQSKKKEVKYDSGGDLPAGIENGIARLVECKFDEYKKGDNQGEPYFLAAGIVVEPAEHNGVPIKGMRTQIGPEPLCDTPNKSRATLEEHTDWLKDELGKLLGVKPEDIDFDDLEPAAQALKEEGPYFRFRTWAGSPSKEYPNPRTNHVWKGKCDYSEDEGDNAVQDNTAQAPKAAPAKSLHPTRAKPTDPAPWEKDEQDDLMALAKLADSGDEDAQEKLAELAEKAGVDHSVLDLWTEVVEAMQCQSQTAADPSHDDVDLASLGASADDGEEGAQEQLTALAKEAGLDPDSPDYPTWAKLATALSGSGGTNGQAPPEKGELWMFKPKGARKAIECEVTAVFEKSRTCNLRNLDDNKSYKAVGWGELAQQ